MRHTHAATRLGSGARGHGPAATDFLCDCKLVGRHFGRIARRKAPLLGLEFGLALFGFELPAQSLVFLALPLDVFLALALGLLAQAFLLFLFLALAFGLFLLLPLAFFFFLALEFLEPLLFEQRVLPGLAETS